MLPEGTEIIIIGCGENHQFLPQSEIKQINDIGIAIEVMATRQACHTFQVLTYENREINGGYFVKFGIRQFIISLTIITICASLVV